MKHLAILLCLLASAAMAENNPLEWHTLTQQEAERGIPTITEKTTTIAIDRKTCLDLGGQLVNVWENAGSVFYICMKKDQGMRD